MRNPTTEKHTLNALREEGMAYPEQEQVRDDLHELTDAIIYECGKDLGEKGAYEYGLEWTETRPHYLNALRYTDLCLWRADIMVEAHISDTGSITQSDAQDVIHFFVAHAYAAFAVAVRNSLNGGAQ